MLTKTTTQPLFLRICWLYHDILNIYGDRGNILTFIYRCQQRGIRVALEKISVGSKLKPNYYDFIFSGGGQDKQQVVAAKDLQTKKAVLEKYAQSGTPMLLICGSYQLFGHYFLTFDKNKIKGISILDCFTVAGRIRKIGNAVVMLNPDFLKLHPGALSTSHSAAIVGFVNHSGNTYLQNCLPLGKTTKGAGNNEKDKSEGAVFKNVVGTYLHGSVLPKNPHLADFFIHQALYHRYQKNIKLKKLDDTIEWQAHFYCQKLKK